MTTTFPVLAPAGTDTTILVALQLVGVAAIPLNVTALVPCDAPKLVPVTVTDAPAGPELGLKLVMPGAKTPIAALNAASSAPPLSDVDRVALTDTGPAMPWI
jgi:hypothetical protein